MKTRLQGWVCVSALLLYLCCSVHGARPVDDDELAAGNKETAGVVDDNEGIGEVMQKNVDVLQAFLKSLLMILVTELGDETFIIAAIMAMRHPRLVVYVGAMTALVSMTVISTALGYVLPNLISRQATQHAATALYTFFGMRLLWIAWRSKPQASNQDEVEEVEAKLEASEQQPRTKLQQVLNRLCTPVFLEALILTFLAEWGDRSQIATMTLAAEYNPYGVTVGAILGHSICTGTAVLGGQLLAMKISQRTVALSGGMLFLLFAAHNLVYGGHE